MQWLSVEERKALDNTFGIDFSHGKNGLLDAYMIYQRMKRPKLALSNTHSLFQKEGFTLLWFQTPACRYSIRGKCTVCNYWDGHLISGLMNRILPKLKLPDICHTVLINTCGSCLDTFELPMSERLRLLAWLAESNVKRVIFETHLGTLSDENMEQIMIALPEKEIFYEVGAESANIDTLFYCLNKPSVLQSLPSAIERMHRYRATSIVNVMVGAPFLNPYEQIEDARASIEFFLNQQADYITLFPVNIKPHTLAMELYQKKAYHPVPVKLLPEILLKLPESVLNRVNVAWFGDHIEAQVIPPTRCAACGESVSLLNLFNEEEDNSARKEILERIREIECDCLPSYVKKFDARTFYSRIRCHYERILMETVVKGNE